LILGIFVVAVWSTHYISPFSIATVDANLRLPVRTSPELKSTSNLSGIGGDHIALLDERRRREMRASFPSAHLTLSQIKNIAAEIFLRLCCAQVE
jgi:hypothetical protein